MKEDLKIEYIDIEKLNHYANNSKIHTKEQIKHIANSIQEFGFNDPLGIAGEDNVVLEGNGRVEATKLLKELNDVKDSNMIIESLSKSKYLYRGNLYTSEQTISIELKDKENGDFSYILLNNPPSKSEYIGGIGTVNSVSKGREHNPCVQYIIVSKKVIEKPDGDLYNCLKLDDYMVKLDNAIDDAISLFKRLYVEKNEISLDLSENQKRAIVQNKLEYHFYDILESNAFRFAKVSNKEDDAVFKLIREAAND